MIDKNIIKTNINKEVKGSYIDYAMSVIISRALPDVRDGLKPVHRRILYSMYKLGISYKKGYKKSARIVGEVLGKYHPHGDKSVYDSIVRMAQKWTLRYKLISGQGNFGSIDNDPPAAMRYTEIKLDKISDEILDDIKYNTVKMKSNFDDTLLEPIILPTKIPNIIINGCTGIAVGMATNMPPHNLKNTINAILKYINNPNIDLDRLIKTIKGPDFPTGGIILSYKGVRDAYKTGRGKIFIRSKYYIKVTNNHKYIVISEIPYQIIKSSLIKNIYNLVKLGKIDEIENIKDESNKNGIRIILLLKKNSIPDIVINKLLKFSDLEISYHINNIALVDGVPKLLNLKELIYYFIKHRNNVIINKSKHFLLTLKKQLHLLEGFKKISNRIDTLLKLIKKSKSYKDSFSKIQKNFKLSVDQIKYILNIRLYKLTNSEIKKLYKNYKSVKLAIIGNKKIIKYKDKRMEIIKEELYKIKEKYGDSRRTLIDFSDCENLNYKKINFIENLRVLIILTKNGYIKRILVSEFKTQKRGGIGSRCIKIEKDDSIKKVMATRNHSYIMFFTFNGTGYIFRVFKIPIGNKVYKGRAIQNFIRSKKEIQTFIFIKTLEEEKYINNHYIVIVTKFGIVKRTILNKYINIRKNGIKSIVIKKEDPLLDAILTNGKSKILIAINNGKAIIFDENNIKLTNRNTIGVKGILLDKKKDSVIGMVSYNNIKKEVLVVSENGYGKRTSLKNYRVTNRGCVGVKTINITRKTGKLISISIVSNKDNIIIVKNNGLSLRISVSTIRIVGRNSQGVKLIKLNKGEKISSVVLLTK